MNPFERAVLASLVAFEAAVLARLTAVERELAAANTSAAERRLLLEIAEATAGTLFTASELATHADAIPGLRAALVGALGASEVPRRLGKLLSRLESASPYTIERCGTEGNAILWKVVLPAKLSLPVEPVEPIAEDRPSTARV